MKISVLFLALLRIELSDIIKLLILVSSFFLLVSYPCDLAIRRCGEPGSGASETLQYN
jgi:hypothetical protein